MTEELGSRGDSGQGPIQLSSPYRFDYVEAPPQWSPLAGLGRCDDFPRPSSTAAVDLGDCPANWASTGRRFAGPLPAGWSLPCTDHPTPVRDGLIRSCRTCGSGSQGPDRAWPELRERGCAGGYIAVTEESLLRCRIPRSTPNPYGVEVDSFLSSGITVLRQFEYLRPR